ncbi:MAG: hypothetical protein WCK33_04435 [Phycisphaerae bacterium]|jgi:hypothetical protein
MSRRPSRTFKALAAGACAWLAGLAPAQPAATPPAQEPPKPAAPKPAAEPTLDELLGITPEPKGPGDEASKDAAKAELERKLSLEELDDAFAQAVKLMDDTAKRLGESKDAGIDTQRMQEQALAKIDKLIDMARSQQQQQKQKRRQKQDQQQQQQQQQQSSQQQQQQQASAQQQGGEPTGGQGSQQGGRVNAPPGAGAAWGNLPARLRDALLQGSGDVTSAKWESLTREYYKRLAEQPGGAK